MRLAVIALGIAVAVAGCAAKQTASTDQSATGTRTTRRDNVITLQEIRENGTSPSLSDLIRQVRPGWPNQVTVFVNNDAFGGYESLRNLSVSNTSEIRFITKSEAQMKWGSRFQDVIQVITR
jgi:hypothetical protein